MEVTMILLSQNFPDKGIFKKNEIQIPLLLHISLSPNHPYIKLARSNLYF